MNTMRRFANNQHIINGQQSIAARRRCYKRPFQKISPDGPVTRRSSEPGARRTDATQRTAHGSIPSGDGSGAGASPSYGTASARACSIEETAPGDRGAARICESGESAGNGGGEGEIGQVDAENVG